MKYLVFLAVYGICSPLVAQEKPAEAEPIEVFATEVKKSEIFEPMVFGGFVKAVDARLVGPEVAGTLVKVSVKLGQKVKRGQELMRIRPSGAGLDFRDNIVRSPMAGIVATIAHDSGKLLQSGEGVITIADTRALEVDFHATYDDLFHLQVGKPVDVVVAHRTANEQKVAGVIQSMAPAADAATGTYPVSVKLSCDAQSKNDCSRSFKLGSLVRIVKKKNLREGIKVPVRYLHSQRRRALTVSPDGKAHWVNVKLGQYLGGEVEVLEGLSVGARLVSNFASYPREGDPLVVKSKEEEERLIFSKGNESKPRKSGGDKKS